METKKVFVKDLRTFVARNVDLPISGVYGNRYNVIDEQDGNYTLEDERGTRFTCPTQLTSEFRQPMFAIGQYVRVKSLKENSWYVLQSDNNHAIFDKDNKNIFFDESDEDWCNSVGYVADVEFEDGCPLYLFFDIEKKDPKWMPEVMLDPYDINALRKARISNLLYKRYYQEYVEKHIEEYFLEDVELYLRCCDETSIISLLKFSDIARRKFRNGDVAYTLRRGSVKQYKVVRYNPETAEYVCEDNDGDRFIFDSVKLKTAEEVNL